MKRLITCLVIIIFTVTGFAQISDDKEIRIFFEQKGELEKNDKTSIYAFELITNNKYNKSDKYGIYRIGIFADHSFEYLLFVNNGKKQFVDCYSDLPKILDIAFSFLDNSTYHFTDADKLLYIKEIISLYDRNQNAVPW